MTASASAGSQACAACKYLRKRCAADCPLAPHFPSNHSSDFLNAHKLFGVSNILKTLKKLHTFDEKKNAVKSMIYQANARARDPAGGCYRIITRLEDQIEIYQLQLSRARQLIAFYQRLASYRLQVSPLNMYGITTSTLQSILCGQQQQEESSFVNENYQTDGTIVKIDMEKLAPSCLDGNDSQPASSGKPLFAMDRSEDIKPLLGEFDVGGYIVGQCRFVFFVCSCFSNN
ncbi:hypothetical protein P3X46_019773 [Hevea brasiliensis]|uniref:LOB domain-containing protein n=1 Tax=Hevea brasiliensis TaxID=3981 RepID=A0ABQ9LLT4_HEVBR|nr:hypothetical protein P3X46_019773 [Hevea brasiliensis]